MTIERIDYWDKSLSSGDFSSAVKSSPDEAKLLFGNRALRDLDPTNLAMIIFAHRTLLMTDGQIDELRARIRREIRLSTSLVSSNDQSYSASSMSCGEMPITQIGLHVSEGLAAAPDGSRAKQLRMTALSVLQKNGIPPLKNAI